ncbi:MAG TPA: hypothetical protein VKA15_03570 [Isosphaeraceae bacterium]|nr:hypothetical protein [Isosphaeraceae bacterium]
MAQKTRLITTSGTAALLWQTSTGVAPDTAVAPTSGIYRAGTVNDPVPIIIQNQDGTNSVEIGGSGVATGPTGTILLANQSITRNVVGNDSEYVVAVAGTPVVSVEVGRQ